MFEQDGHAFTFPKNDNRCFPDEAASAPFDVDGYHWKEYLQFPETPGYYMVALAKEYGNSYLGLPVEKAYYMGAGEWSRRRCPRNSLLRQKYYWEDEDGSCMLYTYYVEYWCEIPESGELLPCIFDW